MKPRLVTIRFSHFCEKARWALQRAGVEFDEEFHAPVLHVPAVKKAGGKRTTPVLVLPDRILADSTDILHWADEHGARLYPSDPAARARVEAWEDLFDEKLGPATRRLAYFLIFQTPRAYVMPTMLAAASGPGERRLLGPLYPLIRFAMRKSMNIYAKPAERSAAVIEEVCSKVEAALADGRSFLEGDTLTAADVTFAALFAPMLGPPNYGAPMPGFLDVPAPFAPVREAMTARPAGQFAARLYRDHRDVVLR